MAFRTIRSLLLVISTACVLAPAAYARDRNRDRDRDQDQRESPPAAVEARAAADAAYQRQDFPKVIEVTSWLIRNFPLDHAHVAYHLRASAKIELGRSSVSPKQIREGIADARQALSLAGGEYPWLHIPYLYGLSSLAEIEKRPEHADQAIKVITPVLQLPTRKDYTAEDRANLFYQRALAYAARGDFSSAAKDQGEAIRLNPEHLGAHVKRAAAYAALGQNQQALAAYDEAVHRFPDDVVVHNDRGFFRRSSGDLDGAIGDFTRCLALDSKFAVGYINRGLCLSEQNNPRPAEVDFSQALALKLDGGLNVSVLRLRASARLAQGKAAAGINDLSAAIRSSSQDATLFEERAQAHFFEKNFSAAASDFARARQLSPQAARIIFWQSAAHARGGQVDQARSLLENEMNGKSPPTGWPAKTCAFLLEQLPEDEYLAAAADSDAREKNRRSCEAHYFAGQAELIRGEQTKAAERFRQAVATGEFSLASYRGARFELGDFK